MVLGKRLICIGFLIFSAVYLAASLSSYPLGKASSPGPGLMPVAIGIAMNFFSLLHVIEVFFFEKGHSAEKEQGGLQREAVLRVAGLAISLAVYAVLYSILGYTLSTIFLVGAILRLLAMHGWTRIALISIVTSACSYYIFSAFLEIPLPQGILPF